ncbi:hypothetical protein PR048_022126 [Dryococelus australis]|uniref:Uncharacterized protein n=1 Tax=Dryococelus australis TaxID=614101 RepID=A0ABQ9H0D6_9NEOP|nr:hypothetical protein PR048_022126 [Dryococelus australis]
MQGRPEVPRGPHSLLPPTLLASHQGEPSSIPGGVAPGFSLVEIVSDNAIGQRVFSGISRFPRPCSPTLLRTHLASPLPTLKTSLLRATQISSLPHSSLEVNDIPEEVDCDTTVGDSSEEVAGTVSIMLEEVDGSAATDLLIPSATSELKICRGGAGLRIHDTIPRLQVGHPTPELFTCPAAPCRLGNQKFDAKNTHLSLPHLLETTGGMAAIYLQCVPHDRMGQAHLARYGACTSGAHVVDVLTYHFLKTHEEGTASNTHVSLKHGNYPISTGNKKNTGSSHLYSELGKNGLICRLKQGPNDYGTWFETAILSSDDATEIFNVKEHENRNALVCAKILNMGDIVSVPLDQKSSFSKPEHLIVYDIVVRSKRKKRYVSVQHHRLQHLFAVAHKLRLGRQSDKDFVRRIHLVDDIVQAIHAIHRFYSNGKSRFVQFQQTHTPAKWRHRPGKILERPFANPEHGSLLACRQPSQQHAVANLTQGLSKVLTLLWIAYTSLNTSALSRALFRRRGSMRVYTRTRAPISKQGPLSADARIARETNATPRKRTQWKSMNRLACSPPTKANRVQYLAGSPDFCKWELCMTMALVIWFSRGYSVFPAPSFRRRSIFTTITLIGSQDLAELENFANSSRDNIDVKHIRSEVTLANGSQFIRPALHVSETITDLQENTSRIPELPCVGQQPMNTQLRLHLLGSPLVDDWLIINAVKYRLVSGVVWTNRTMASSNTDTNRTGVLAVVDIVCFDALLVYDSTSRTAMIERVATRTVETYTMALAWFDLTVF